MPENKLETFVCKRSCITNQNNFEEKSFNYGVYNVGSGKGIQVKNF